MSESERDIEGSNGHRAPGYGRSPAIEAVTNGAEQLRRLDDELIERVREKPLAAVAIALAAGYVIGRFFSRWG